MNSRELHEVLEEVRAWLLQPDEAQEYRTIKLRLLIKYGFVNLADAMQKWRDRQQGF